MTNEQWLVYIYGIYPNGGWSFLLIMWALSALIAFLMTTFVDGKEWNQNVYVKVNRFGKTMFISLALLFISNFVPDKKTFVAIVATPTIVDSYKKQDGKLYKMDLIIDKIFDKTISELDPEKTKDKK